MLYQRRLRAVFKSLKPIYTLSLIYMITETKAETVIKCRVQISRSFDKMMILE